MLEQGQEVIPSVSCPPIVVLVRTRLLIFRKNGWQMVLKLYSRRQCSLIARCENELLAVKPRFGYETSAPHSLRLSKIILWCTHRLNLTERYKEKVSRCCPTALRVACIYDWDALVGLFFFIFQPITLVFGLIGVIYYGLIFVICILGFNTEAEKGNGECTPVSDILNFLAMVFIFIQIWFVYCNGKVRPLPSLVHFLDYLHWKRKYRPSRVDASDGDKPLDVAEIHYLRGSGNHCWNSKSPELYACSLRRPSSWSPHFKCSPFMGALSRWNSIQIICWAEF